MGKEIRFRLSLADIDEKLSFLRGRIIANMVLTLRTGGLVIYPTETSYMLAGDATNERAVQRLRALKNRASDQDMSVMCSSMEKAQEWTVWNSKAREFGKKYLPGPFTFIVPVRESIKQFASISNTLGIRVPEPYFLQALLSCLDFPVTATSANPHGGPEPYSIDDCVSGVDCSWDAGLLSPNPPSTIISFTKPIPSILRAGAVIPSELT